MWKNLFILILAFLFITSSGAYGQESAMPLSQEETVVTTTVGTLVTVATVNIDALDVSSRDDRTFDVSATFSNQEGAQPQIGYFVRLIKTNEDGSQEVVHTYTYQDLFNIGEFSQVQKNFSYTAPDYLTGEYSLWLFVENKNSVPLSFTPIKENIKLIATEKEKILFDTLSCFLEAESAETGQVVSRTYAFVEGIDINAEKERLMLSCEVSSSYNETKTATPKIVIQKRGVLGDIISEQALSEQQITLSPQEKKTLRLTVPLVNTPQAYEATLSLWDKDQKEVSSSVNFHYVVQGESGTIQNVLFDASAYKSGDTAHINFFWNPSADQFYLARGGGGTEVTGDPFVEFTVLDGQGVACSEDVRESLNKQSIQHTLTVPITSDCNDPNAVFALKNGDGKILDEQKMSIATPTSPDSQQGVNSFEGEGIFVGIIILVSVLCLGVLTFYLYLRKKNRRDGNGGIGMSVLFLSLLFSGYFFGGVSDASAGTKAYDVLPGLYPGKMTYTYSVTLSGSTVTVTGSSVGTACSNLATNASLSAAHCASPNNVPCTFSNLINKQEPEIDWTAGHYQRSLSYTGTKRTFTKVSGNNTVRMWAGFSLTDKLSWISEMISDGSLTETQLIADGWNHGTTGLWSISKGDYFHVPIPSSPSAPPSGSGVDGACGVNVGFYTSLDTSWRFPTGMANFCDAGTLEGSMPSFPDVDFSTTWTCLGHNGGDSVGCTARREAVPEIILRYDTCSGAEFPSDISDVSVGTTYNVVACTGSGSDFSSIVTWVEDTSDGGAIDMRFNGSSYDVTAREAGSERFFVRFFHSSSGRMLFDTATITVVDSIPSGTISVYSCTIPLNQSTCQTNLNWVTTNVTDGLITRDGATIIDSISGNGTQVIENVGKSPITFNLYADATGTGTPLGSGTIVGSCGTGNSWDSGTGTCIGTIPYGIPNPAPTGSKGYREVIP